MNSVTDLASAQQLCQQITHRRGANFSVGFRFLPARKRAAVYAAYAFCRYADDVADHHAESQGGSSALALERWEQELDRIYSGRPGHRIGLALAHALEQFPIPRAAFADLIAGCRDDLAGRRYETFDELLGYCALVAEPIGRICLAIFGAVQPAAHQCGRSLSRALQLTNILRDVGEDARNGRVYLPLGELARFGVREEALGAGGGGDHGDGFEQVMRLNLVRAQQFYEAAAPLPDAIEPDARLTTRLMAAVYHEILQRIAAQPRQVLVGTVALTPAEKAALIARHTRGPTPADDAAG